MQVQKSARAAMDEQGQRRGKDLTAGESEVVAGPKIGKVVDRSRASISRIPSTKPDLQDKEGR